MSDAGVLVKDIEEAPRGDIAAVYTETFVAARVAPHEVVTYGLGWGGLLDDKAVDILHDRVQLVWMG